MNRIYSPRQQPSATQVARISADARPFVPTQKKTISKAQYLLLEEWAPESISDYQVADDVPVVDQLSPPKPAQRAQRQPQLQQRMRSVTNVQYCGSNRRMQANNRSSEMFEEWKARSLVSPEKAREAGVASSSQTLRDDKVKKVDVSSPGLSMQEEIQARHSALPFVPNHGVEQSSVTPTSSQKTHETRHNAASTITESERKQTVVTSVSLPDEKKNIESTAARFTRDQKNKEPSAPALPIAPSTAGNTTPIVRDSQVKDANATPGVSSKLRRRRRSSTASGISNKKGNETDIAPISLPEPRHKRGGSAASNISNNKGVGVGVASSAVPQVNRDPGEGEPIVNDNRVLTRDTISISSQLESKPKERDTSHTTAGRLEERPEEAANSTVKPQTTCDVQAHQQELKYQGDVSADPPTSVASASVTRAPAENPTKTTRVKASKRGRGDEKVGSRDRQTQSRGRLQQKAAYTAPDGTRFSRHEMENMARGNKVEGRDSVYFLPCFIEDPWKGMEPVRAVHPTELMRYDGRPGLTRR